MKSNSIKSYYDLVESGELSKKQVAVANCFRKMGPMTGRQAAGIVPGAWKRCAELRDMGILKVDRTTKDPYTGKVATVWRWSGDEPLLVPIKVGKIANKLSPIYDKAYEQGVRDTLYSLYGTMCGGIDSVIEEMAKDIMARIK